MPIGGGQCTYCATQNIACSRAGSIIQPKAVPVSPLSIATPTTPSVTEIIVASPPGITPFAAVSDKALCFELVELYFKYIHDCLHSLFHRPSFMLDLHEGTAPLALVYGMMALSARYVMIETVYPSESLLNYLRFSSNPIFNGIVPISRGELFANECNMLLNLRDVSLTSIQACVLLGAYSIVEGEAGAESVFYSAACRIANYLDLPNLPTPDPLQREIHIRGTYRNSCVR